MRLGAGRGRKLDRLTNVRFANDLILFAKSSSEIEEMTALLVGEFAKMGLAANGSKTELLTTDVGAPTGPTPQLVDIAGVFAGVHDRPPRKVIGKALLEYLTSRGQKNMDHRLSRARVRFYELRRALPRLEMIVKMRLRLSDAVVSPTVSHSLSTTLSQHRS